MTDRRHRLVMAWVATLSLFSSIGVLADSAKIEVWKTGCLSIVTIAKCAVVYCRYSSINKAAHESEKLFSGHGKIIRGSEFDIFRQQIVGGINQVQRKNLD